MEKLQGTINWEKDYKTGLERANSDNRPVLLDFFQGNLKLDDQVFANLPNFRVGKKL